MSNFRKVLSFLFLVGVIFFCSEFAQKNIATPAIRSTSSGQVSATKNLQVATVVKTTSPRTVLGEWTKAGLVSVVRVVDGDTIVVTIGDRDETVRLLGIDAPETVDPRKPVQCFGIEASNETKSLLDGRQVFLQIDPTQSDRDKYGRLLRYVFRDDGLFVDEFLIKSGFAFEYTYLGVPYKYQTAFRADQVAARLAGLGLWAKSSGCPAK